VRQSSDSRATDMFEYPFDQYQRYQDVRQVVDVIRAATGRDRLTILDVGGTDLAERFLPDDVVTRANLERSPGVQLQTDGTRLALRDGSVDVVITVDTLEHIPEPRRSAFLAELSRVAGEYVIVTGPFANAYSPTADHLLNAYFVSIAGIVHRFLSEHLEHGLPDPEATCRALGANDRTIMMPSGYLHHWLPFMIIKYELQRMHGGHEISVDLDRFYNHQAYWSDHRAPSYRQLIVSAKHDQPDVLSAIRSQFSQEHAAEAPDLNGVLAMWHALRWKATISAYTDEIQRLHAHIARQSAELAQLQREHEQARALVHGYERGRFIRLMAALKRFAGS
jgi:hypothetical protein